MLNFVDRRQVGIYIHISNLNKTLTNVMCLFVRLEKCANGQLIRHLFLKDIKGLLLQKFCIGEGRSLNTSTLFFHRVPCVTADM